MKEVLEYIAILSTIFAGCVLLYEYLDDAQKRNHKQKISEFLRDIQSMRSLELAQNDAAIILSWLNYFYGKPSENRFFARDFWLWRPLWVSIFVATAYLAPVVIFAAWSSTLWDIDIAYITACIILYSFLVCINASLDLVSVNVSRFLFYKMSKSSHLRDIVLFILIDFVIAILLYLTGPAWVSIIEVDYFSAFLKYIQFWKLPRTDDKFLLGVMFLTTLVPTIFHFLISIVFFFSKTFAQPVRIGFEKTLEFMISKPKGVTTLVALFGTIIIWIFAWIIDILRGC